MDMNHMIKSIEGKVHLTSSSTSHINHASSQSQSKTSGTAMMSDIQSACQNPRLNPNPNTKHSPFTSYSPSHMNASQSIHSMNMSVLSMGVSNDCDPISVTKGAGINIRDREDLLRDRDKNINLGDFHELFQELRYEIHRELQSIVKEQIRQFSIAKSDMERIVGSLAKQMDDLLIANRELREENERLRKIY
jgi:hypothetical protein